MPNTVTSDETAHPQYLDPSELGTKEYWETYYTRSLEHISTKTKTLFTSQHDTSGEREREPRTEITQQGEDVDEDEDEDEEDDDDPGTSWFSEHDAPGKVLRYLTSRKFPLSPKNTNKNAHGRTSKPSILDLGTGNGSMLALLRKRGGFQGVMVGVDYSAQSVQLARELQRLKLHSAYESGDDDDDESEEDDSEEEEHEDVVVAANNDSDDGNAVVHTEAIPVQEQDIRFEEWDILDPANEDLLSGKVHDTDNSIPWFPYDTRGFDIVLDKGTFDAISLSDETTAAPTPSLSSSTNHICHKYPIIATQLVRPGGYLIVTSCNWTEDELVQWFTTATPKQELEVWHRLEYPRFRFGGQEGQGVCTVCFRKTAIV